jgi:hypothetical protein
VREDKDDQRGTIKTGGKVFTFFGFFASSRKAWRVCVEYNQTSRMFLAKAAEQEYKIAWLSFVHAKPE